MKGSIRSSLLLAQAADEEKVRDSVMVYLFHALDT